MSATGTEVRTILVIDDSDIVLEAARSILEPAGYRVITRNRPSGSITAILNEKPDVVLLDLNMPTLSGEAILKVLGKTQNRPDSMVLLHSSLPLETLRLKTVSSGAHGYIQKTENSAEFLRRIEFWMRKTHLTSSGRIRASRPSGEYAAPIELRNVPSEGRSTPIEIREVEPPSVRALSTPNLPTPPSARVPMHWVGSPEAVPAASAKTMFVDDDWMILNAYKSTFASELDAEYVASGEEAISRVLSSEPPQIVVCDLVMPYLTGADVYKRALAYDGTWSQRFLFVTGAAAQRSIGEFLNGVDVRVFFKPVPPDRLLEAIRKVEATVLRRRAEGRAE